MLNRLIGWCVKRQIQFLSFSIKKLEVVANQPGQDVPRRVNAYRRMTRLAAYKEDCSMYLISLRRREFDELTVEIIQYWDAAAAADVLGDYLLYKQLTAKALELEARRNKYFPSIQTTFTDASVPASA